MTEKQRKTNIKPLVYMAFGLAIIIIIGFITLNQPEYEYSMSLEETHQSLLEAGTPVSPEAAAGFKAGESGDVQFIDLRNEYEYNIGHIDGAIHIPRHSLLKEDNYEILQGLMEDGVQIILYGSNSSQANGPWMILCQLGMDNVNFLEGGYEAFLKAKTGEAYALTTRGTKEELPAYDYRSLVDSIISEYSGGMLERAEPEPRPEPVVPVKRQKQTKIEGGC